MWIAGLCSVLVLLRGHENVEAAGRPAIVKIARGAAMMMDVGSLLAIVLGLGLAFSGPINAFKTGAWLHIKLAVVVIAIIGSQVYLRIKLKHARQGQAGVIPSWLLPAIWLASAIIIALGANQSLLRK